VICLWSLDGLLYLVQRFLQTFAFTAWSCQRTFILEKNGCLLLHPLLPAYMVVRDDTLQMRVAASIASLFILAAVAANLASPAVEACGLSALG
jgi:hypothetical protein